MKPKGLCLTIKVRHVLLAQENMPWSLIFVYLRNYTGGKIQGQLQSFGVCVTGVTQVRAVEPMLEWWENLPFASLVLYEVGKKWS